jgi:hypothetical protein
MKREIRTILFFIRGYKGRMALVSLFSVLFAVFEGLNVAVLFPLISLILQLDLNAAGGPGLIRILNRVIGFIPVNDPFIAACLLIIIVVLLKNVFR